MNNAATRSIPSVNTPLQIVKSAGWFAIVATVATIFLLVTLHVLSPEFSPSWRMINTRRNRCRPECLQWMAGRTA